MTTEIGDQQHEVNGVNEVSEVEGYAAGGGGMSRPSTIEISSFSWGASNMLSQGGGSGLGSGRAVFHDIQIMK